MLLNTIFVILLENSEYFPLSKMTECRPVIIFIAIFLFYYARIPDAYRLDVRCKIKNNYYAFNYSQTFSDLKFVANNITYIDYGCGNNYSLKYGCIDSEHIRTSMFTLPGLKQMCGTFIGMLHFEGIFYSVSHLIQDKKMLAIPTLHGSFYYPHQQIFHQWQEFNVSGEVYDSIVTPLMCYHATYGHFIRDAVSMFYFIPSEIAEKSYFSLSTDCYEINDIMSILSASGINENRITFIEPKTFYYCKNLYMVYGFTQAAYGFAFLPKFKKNILEYYGIESTPENYVIHRRGGAKRAINNFKEVCYFVKANFPEYGWTLFPNVFPTFRQTVVQYSRVKFYFSSTGSSMTNIIFMKENTGAVYYIFDFYDPPVIFVSNIFRIWTKCFKLYDHKHFRDNCTFTKTLLDLLKITMIDVMCSMETLQWKSSKQCHNMYDEVEGFYNKSLDVLEKNIRDYTLQEVNYSHVFYP